MDRKHYAIGIPTFGTTSMRWTLAYQALALPMNSKVARVVKQGFEIGVARNWVVSDVLSMDPRPTHIFFMDDDVIPATPWPFLRLLTHKVDVVAGVYFLKGEYGQPLAFRPPGMGTEPYDPRRGLVPIWGIGMGITLIRTQVFDDLSTNLDLGTDELGNPRWFYTSGDKPGESQATEDLWFCEHRLHKLGITPHVDMSPQCFGWHYELKDHTAHPRRQWEEFLKTGSVNWEVFDDGNCIDSLRNTDRVSERCQSS